jgi:hypothetical protein
MKTYATDRAPPVRVRLLTVQRCHVPQFPATDPAEGSKIEAPVHDCGDSDGCDSENDINPIDQPVTSLVS